MIDFDPESEGKSRKSSPMSDKTASVEPEVVPEPGAARRILVEEVRTPSPMGNVTSNTITRK